MLAVMKDAGGQHGVGPPLQHALGQMRQRADAATGDDRDVHRVGNGPRQGHVEAVLRAVAIHAGQQDLAGAQLLHASRPLDCVQPGALAAAVGEYLPASVAGLLGVDGHHDALRTDLAGGVRHQLRILHRCGVHAYLVGARIEQPAHVIDDAHAAAHRQRNEHFLGHLFDDMNDDVALVRAGRDVEKRDLVGTLLVVAARDLDRIACIAQALEIDALDDAAGLDVEAGNDALGEHGKYGSRFAPAYWPPLESLSASAWAFLKSSVPS